jgi:histidinol phosphatase-like enzyme
VLYAFDVDGTLVKPFIRDEPCERCHGKRRVPIVDNWERLQTGGSSDAPCPDCVARYDTVELLPGRAGALWRLTEDPVARFALVTNQAGVAFGYQTMAQVGEKLARVALACEFFYARPFSIHIAVGHPKAKIIEYRDPLLVARRKPAPTMLEEAIARHGVTADGTVFVGDMDSDRECAAAAGVEYVDASEFFGSTS